MELNEEVAALLESGTEPLTMTRSIVRDCKNRMPRAYRTTLQVNSLEIGAITDAEYTLTAERTKRSILLFARALMYAERAIDQCRAAGFDFDWISVRCPPSAVTRSEVYDTILRVFAGNEVMLPKLCIEFSTKLLFDPETDKILETFSALKEAGIKTMLYDFGEEFCPTMRLLAYDFDYVSLHKDVVDMMRSPATEESAKALMQYVQGFSIEIVAPGIDTSEAPTYGEIGCYGFTDNFPGRLFDEEGTWQKVTA